MAPSPCRGAISRDQQAHGGTITSVAHVISGDKRSRLARSWSPVVIFRVIRRLSTVDQTRAATLGMRVNHRVLLPAPAP